MLNLAIYSKISFVSLYFFLLNNHLGDSGKKNWNIVPTKFSTKPIKSRALVFFVINFRINIANNETDPSTTFHIVPNKACADSG